MLDHCRQGWPSIQSAVSLSVLFLLQVKALLSRPCHLSGTSYNHGPIGDTVSLQLNHPLFIINNDLLQVRLYMYVIEMFLRDALK